MFAKAYKHGVMQLLPHTCSIPVTQAPPTRHAAAIAQSLRQVFPSNASLQNKQDAIEGCLITDGALAAATFARCNEGRNEWFELFPQLFTNGNTRHTAAKHKCFSALQKKVALAALNTPATPTPCVGASVAGRETLACTAQNAQASTTSCAHGRRQRPPMARCNQVADGRKFSKCSIGFL